MSLDSFHPAVACWFRERFGTPTPAQTEGWAAIGSGRDTLIMAPTGSGKTLAAFLSGLDGLVRRALLGALEEQVRVVYVSPLKALGADIERNLDGPLREIEHTCARLGRLLPPIHTAVRSGDTSATERARMLRHPPHVLITTPESLYLLLTSVGGRRILAGAETVILDEIHALSGNKRGAHLALSLERLDALCQRRLQRIGLSATVEPIEDVARFLVGTDRPCQVVDAGRSQPLDLTVEVPGETLSAVASRRAWEDVYTRIGALLAEHRSMLIFVPSRRLAERVAHDLEQRLVPLFGAGAVAAHHGALAKRTRQSVERRLQSGELRAVVATASLELGIDIGHIDLVVQLGSPRAIAVLRQRVGRADHAVGGTPKGRLFALTRDELLECAALVRAIRGGRMDRALEREAPLDILAQQLVAAAAAEPWSVEDLWQLVRRAAPYSTLARQAFDDVLDMLGDGISTRRGRAGAHLHLDRVNRRVRGRRGSRLAALTSGGAIPDKADYQVIEDPSEAVVGTLDEDFAIESMAGDIFLLGSTSWRVRRVENGRVRVENAHGAPPSVPFWNGEGLARTEELSREVAALREELAARTHNREDAIAWIMRECALDRAGAEQAVDYVTEGARALGAVPTCERVVAERFFDEAGGMQLVIHAPFGARVNRAWGLGLRKKFCRSFDFELQAAATDDAILLSLGPQHSFPLDAIFGFLHANAVEPTLLQAALQSPMWETRWRWNTTRALAVLRYSRGKRTPPQILRMRAADLSAAVFPAQAGCQDNHGGGDLELPDHPLVNETARDCLTEAMDAPALVRLLQAVARGEVQCLARDTVAPSPFAHGILAANPYAFLDDAPLEERRARAVSTARPGELLDRDLRTLDAAVVAEVLAERQPSPRDPDELHDLLCTAIVLAPQPAWARWFAALLADGRACEVQAGRASGPGGWAAAERISAVRAIYPAALFTPPLAPPPGGPTWDEASATAALVSAELAGIGPTTAALLGERLGLEESRIEIALAALESDGQVLQGTFFAGASGTEWCDRGLLQRIHRRTLGTLRAQVQPVAPAELIRFLLRWQHVQPGTQLHGVEGLLRVVEQLQGLELQPAAWERDVLPARIAHYDPAWLDELCLSGEVAWARLRLDPPEEEKSGRPRTGAIGLFLRTHAGWLMDPYAHTDKTSPSDWPHLSARARAVAAELERRGAAFAADLVSALDLPIDDVEAALWELVRTGAVSSDGFAALRALIAPRAHGGLRRRVSPGRWALVHRHATPRTPDAGPFGDGSPVERARLYLRRYGVVLRDLLAREAGAPPWRELVAVYRRLEARGEIRGGRFVSGLSGEQFALPEALESLRALGSAPRDDLEVQVAATDPLNLVGILTPGSKVPLQSARVVVYRDGVPLDHLRAASCTSRSDQPASSPGLSRANTSP